MAVDAVGSVTFGMPPGVRYQIGIGSAIVPGNMRRHLYDEITHVSDAEAFATTRRLVKEEGLLVGGSAGAAVFAALKLAERLPATEKVLAILPDRGDRYYNTIFSDEWLEKNAIELDKHAVKNLSRGVDPISVSLRRNVVDRAVRQARQQLTRLASLPPSEEIRLPYVTHHGKYILGDKWSSGFFYRLALPALPADRRSNLSGGGGPLDRPDRTLQESR
ncbi:pyridoxal-phosphate dependent enzyme [Paenibacillus rhizoplanae]